MRAPSPPGLLTTLRRHYFATPLQGLVSLLCITLIVTLGWKLLNWALLSAVFDASRGPAACEVASGACWSVIAARLQRDNQGANSASIRMREGLGW